MVTLSLQTRGLTKHHNANIQSYADFWINIANSKVTIQQANFYLSKPRFGRYITAVNQDFVRAVELYKAGLKIAAAFHPLLGFIEVILRNQLDAVLTAFFNDPNWIINQKTGFMSDPSLTHLDRRTGKTVVNNFLKKSVETAETNLRKKSAKITASKIIAAQNFSFWTDLFEVHHYRLLQGRPIQIFQKLPTGKGRLEVRNALTNIRLFRNRINHNEPICFNGNTVDFTYPETTHKDILEILSWIEPNLSTWVQDMDTVTGTITLARSI